MASTGGQSGPVPDLLLYGYSRAGSIGSGSGRGGQWAGFARDNRPGREPGSGRGSLSVRRQDGVTAASTPGASSDGAGRRGRAAGARFPCEARRPSDVTLPTPLSPPVPRCGAPATRSAQASGKATSAPEARHGSAHQQNHRLRSSGDLGVDRGGWGRLPATGALRATALPAAERRPIPHSGSTAWL